MKPLAPVLLLVATLAASACSAKSVVVHRPQDPGVDVAVTALWDHDVRRIARDGDWILSRSYYLVGDVIAAVTPGEDLSHASIYDADRGTVIEAVGDGVREIPLAQLLQRNHYVIVVRPSNMTAADQRTAVARAHTRVGSKFDKAGMFGFDNPEAFYCSELVYWASEVEARNGGHERVVTPADLMKYGEVIYWSGTRDDARVMQHATAR
jgi:Permuted papain-like amidase enzyme, YaeF/YiiX, C92 family